MATKFMKIERIIREYCEELYTNKLDHINDMGTFLESQNLPRLNLEEAENLTRAIMNKKMEPVIKNVFPSPKTKNKQTINQSNKQTNKKNPVPNGFSGELSKHLRNN